MRKRTLPLPKPYKGEKNVTLITLEKLRERRVVSRQFIVELCQSQTVKQAERDLMYKVLNRFSPYSKIPVEKFAREVKKELIPLRGKDMDTDSHRAEALDFRLRRDVQQYKEIVYQSPIPTRAGRTHFKKYFGQEAPTPRRYFAHTRFEDMKDSITRRVLEVQSDLFQKNGLDSYEEVESMARVPAELKEEYQTLFNGKVLTLKAMHRLFEIRKIGVQNRKEELLILEAYRNSWQERIIREEMRQAALTGKNRMLFPTGETAIEIDWFKQRIQNTFRLEESGKDVVAEDLKEGKGIYHHGKYWIVTAVHENGKFTALPRGVYEETQGELRSTDPVIQTMGKQMMKNQAQSFDLSQKINTNDPIYRFYEKEIGSYLQKNHDAVRTTDNDGVSWWETPLQKEIAEKPVLAFSSSEKLPEPEKKDPLPAERKNDPTPNAISPPASDSGQNKEQTELDSMRSLREASQERELDSREV
jgi:hypothetical protein